MRILFLLALFLLQDHRESALQGVAALRAEGPAGLERLLLRYDGLKEGAEKEDLERTIDAVAAQRYATFSRLYWYTDFEAAKAAARASGKPILSLRMLGRLDEDLSCANSRLFRVVLYANRELSTFLRENFVLHWSSERPAPHVTIDFGDGRRIETTVAGNSAHYVLDSEGRPLDVLPGLYSPVAFRRELEAVLPLARESSFLADPERRARVQRYHDDRAGSFARLYAASERAKSIPLPVWRGLVSAERLTMGKAAIEIPTVVRAGLGSLGSALSGAGLLELGELQVRRLDEARLDDSSRALVEKLQPTDWAREPRPLSPAALASEIAILEAIVAADTERNELSLHSTIHSWFHEADLPTWTDLNARVYRDLFLTPTDDPWLGFSTPLVFTGLPRDGIAK
jgi:hypothetical protein